MKALSKQLRPYWLTVLVIMLFHVVQAYTTLLLPDITSKLIDTGIQNKGFEYAVPFDLTAKGYQTLSQLMLPDEQEALTQNYQEASDGHYQLKADIKAEPKALSALEKKLIKPLAISQMRQQLTPAQQKAMQSQMALQPKRDPKAMVQAVRQKADQQMDKLGDSVVKSAAIRYVKSEYEASGKKADQQQMRYLWRQGGWMLAVSLLAMLGAVAGHYYSAIVAANIGHDLRRLSFDKVLQFSQKEMNDFSAASLITRSTNDIQQIQLILTVVLRITLFAPVLAVGGIMHVIATKSTMTWIIVVAVVAVLAIVGVLFALTMPRFKRLQSQVDKVNLFAREILTGLQVIRAFGRQETESQRFDGASQELKSTYLFTNRAMSFMMPLMMILMNGVSILIIWVASDKIGQGSMQVGEMTAFMNYAMQIIFSFLMFSMMAVMFPRAMVAAERVQEVIDSPLSIQDPANATPLPSQITGLVKFNHVAFRYQGAQEDTLQEISFEAKPGQTTAIIGSTGAGKSTILQLLMRFYDVTKGQITIDGIDIRQFSQADLRSMMGYVPQKGVLFSGTIESNIAYGVDDLSPAKRDLAAQIAHASEFIQEKEDGYQAAIAQGGSNVSGGQKQRLSIARAIAKDPQIFLFDDSFSALDYRTDASLRKALGEQIKDATVIIVAQRISTVLDADQIIVLDEGQIAGVGNHASLMKTSKVYQEIAQSQLSQVELAQYGQAGTEGQDGR
ncbi:ABC transporter ATP-binding protein [Vaginisenegalia massiliensis]|uniref:ABC transporter ATP-binding protein n=1 Tax=Vaginisenegalia massiliensis TaxID=2058294 RepID=UPI000F526543|nr:ABC transporter ATP-binding protein [Vaginisenegalia massiliensis]